MSKAKAGATRPYPLRIPENLLELAEAKSREERADRSTVLRQLLYAGAEEYVLELLSEGRISAGRAAEILEVSVHRVHRLVEEHDVEIGASLEDCRRSRKEADDLLRQPQPNRFRLQLCRETSGASTVQRPISGFLYYMRIAG